MSQTVSRQAIQVTVREETRREGWKADLTSSFTLKGPAEAPQGVLVAGIGQDALRH